MATGDISHQGMLRRKHEMETATQKAIDRSWENVYCVLHGSYLSGYKDEEAFDINPNKRIHQESPTDLKFATCEAVMDYKYPNVIRLRLASGGEYLFKTKDETERDLWIHKIKAVIDCKGC